MMDSDLDADLRSDVIRCGVVWHLQELAHDSFVFPRLPQQREINCIKHFTVNVVILSIRCYIGVPR